MTSSPNAHSRPLRSALAAALRRLARRPAPPRRPNSARPTGRPAAQGPLPPPPHPDQRLTDWSDAELYSVWCATGAELLKALPAEHTHTAAEARRYLLAEIERRHPDEAAAWLTTSTALAGAPPRFLVR